MRFRTIRLHDLGNPRMALRGVRNSWLIVGGNGLARLASSARRRARSLFVLARSSSAINSSFSA